MTYILAALLLALQVVDWWTTRRILTQENGRELVPTMARVIDRFGFVGLLVVKLVVAAVVSWLFVHFGAWWLLIVADAGFAWVCWHNWGQIK